MRIDLRCLAILVISLSGCQLQQTMHGFRWNRSESDAPPQDEYVDKWSMAGRDGRGSRESVRDNDPFRNILMSPEARAIERNVGIE